MTQQIFAVAISLCNTVWWTLTLYLVQVRKLEEESEKNIKAVENGIIKCMIGIMIQLVKLH